MRLQSFRTFFIVFLSASPVFAQEANLSDFGFRPLEIFKLEKRSQSMVSGDFNSDGRRDLMIADNSHSRLDVLLQRTEKPEVDDPIDVSDVNAIKYDWRFKHEKIPVDKEISALAAGDFNHDGKVDIAYFGVPDRLIVRTQGADNEWPEMLDVRLSDVPKAAWLLVAGDLNHDDRDDLVVLGKTETYLLYQKDNGTLATPQNLMNTSDKLALAQIADLDGDGRNDLSYTADDEGNRALCVRIQTADGRLGPEWVFDLERPRSVTLGDFDDKPGKEIAVVDSRTNRVNVLKLERPETKPEDSLSRIIQYGFGESSAARDREIAIGDMDGDGLLDVVVTDPSAAQLLAFRQHKGQGLDSGTTYPALVGSTQVRIAQFGQAARVLVLSPREKALGLCQFEDGRLTFPTALPLNIDPLAFEVTDLNGDKIPEVLCLGEAREKERSDEYQLAALKWTEKGFEPFDLGEEKTIKFDLDGEPERLKLLDANQDGRVDFLVFGGRTPALLLTDKSGLPKLTKTPGGIQLGEVSREAVYIKPAKAKSSEMPTGALLVAQENFARELVLDEFNKWQVLDQYNASEANAKISGVAALDLDGEAGDEVVLVDTGIRKLRILRQEESLYRRWKEIELGPFPFVTSHAADLNGDGREDLAIFGRNKLGVVYADQHNPQIKRIASYETKLEKAYFADVALGDLNGDGKTDIAAIDTREHYIEILSQDAEAGLKHAMHFKVFEEKSFTASARPAMNPGNP